jgi:hypothetical protein
MHESATDDVQRTQPCMITAMPSSSRDQTLLANSLASSRLPPGNRPAFRPATGLPSARQPAFRPAARLPLGSRPAFRLALRRPDRQLCPLYAHCRHDVGHNWRSSAAGAPQKTTSAADLMIDVVIAADV